MQTCIQRYSWVTDRELTVFSPPIKGEHLAGKFKSEYSIYNCLEIAVLETN